MNNGIIPVPDEVLKYCSLLSDLAIPITLPAEEFGEVWPFVSSVYTNPRELARQELYGDMYARQHSPSSSSNNDKSM
jgi:hypothetical protein